MYIGEGYEGFYLQKTYTPTDGWMASYHRQYARKGHSATDPLWYMLQAVYEAVDSGEASARLFFADFTKGFHFIDHTTDARAGQTRDPSCPPEMDRGLPDQPVASS